MSRELDRAFVRELRDVVEKATEAYEEYEFGQALQLTESFFWNGLTDNFLELVKRRARDELDPEGRASAVAALRLGLDVLLRLFAPVAPTITEEVWSWAFAEEKGQPSIHAAPWPSVEELARIPAPDHAGSFRVACEAIGAVRKAKTEAGIALGRPLRLCALSGSREALRRVEPVLADVAAAANARRVDLRAVTEGEEGAAFAAEIEAGQVSW
ncbi:MAG: class I tRNA ligase family protein [Gemmatimonadetes bacterium]|nr:class I tRNA ligase family protein [Gemmatimonadota bacterium]